MVGKPRASPDIIDYLFATATAFAVYFTYYFILAPNSLFDVYKFNK